MASIITRWAFPCWSWGIGVTTSEIGNHLVRMRAIKPGQVIELDYQHTAGTSIEKSLRSSRGSQITAKMSAITLNKYSAC